MANGLMLTQVRLRRKYWLRGSGYDLSNCKTSPFGRAVSPEQARDLGVEMCEHSRLGLKVLRTGCFNHADTAQRADECALDQLAGFNPIIPCGVDDRFPRGTRILEGVCIDMIMP